MIDARNINKDTPEWRAAMDELRAERTLLVDRLIAFPREDKDDSDVLRGRIMQIDDLLNL